MKFIRKITKKEDQALNSKDAAKERLHLVLMQDRANVSADFLELMKQEIIEVIKKYIDVDENAIDVRLTNKENGDGTKGAPALYANIPIINIKEETKQNTKIDTQEATQGTNKDIASLQSKETKTEDEENKENKKIKKSKIQNDEEVEESENVIHEEPDEQGKKEVVQNTEN